MSHIFSCSLLWKALGCFLLFTGTAQAANTLCSRPIRVALFEFGVLYRSDTNDGIDVRLLKEMERRSGCAFERVVMPRARIWNELQAGNLDMATAAIPTPERKAYANMLPYLQSRNLLLLRKQSAREAWSQDAFETSRLRMFDKGVVDAVLSQPLVYRQHLDERKMQATVVQRDWAPQDQSAVGTLMLARKSFTGAQARQWDQLLVDIQRDGTFQKIAQDFVSPAAAKALAYTGPRAPD